MSVPKGLSNYKTVKALFTVKLLPRRLFAICGSVPPPTHHRDILSVQSPPHQIYFTSVEALQLVLLINYNFDKKKTLLF